MKTVLIPIDFYADVHGLVKDVVLFLRNIDLEFKVFLLKTYLVPTSVSNQIIQAHDESRKASLVQVKRILEEAEKIECVKRVIFEGLAQMGSLTNVIKRLVPERSVDCVILPKSAAKKQDEFLALLQSLHCFVLILPGS